MDYLKGEVSYSQVQPSEELRTCHLASKMQDKDQYESLLSSEEVEYPKTMDSSAPHRRIRLLVLLSITSTIALFAAVTLLSIVSTQVSSLQKSLGEGSLGMDSSSSNEIAPISAVSLPTGEELGNCGHSVAQARELGCIFDPMSWAWQRPECYHADLTADFLKRMDWHFYLSNSTSPSEEVPRESWERGDYRQLWGSHMWHNFHCTYSWRKFHEAFSKKMPMDNDILQMQHTLHCDTVFLHDFDPTLTVPCDDWPGGCQTTELHAGFNKCGWY